VQDQVAITSALRDVIWPILSRFDTLCFDNSNYDGGVCDRNCFSVGTVPGHHAKALVESVGNLGNKIYTIAADHNYGQIISAWVEKYAGELGAEVVEAESFPLDVTAFGPTISRIQAAKPDFVWSALIGTAHVSFSYALATGARTTVPASMGRQVRGIHQIARPPIQTGLRPLRDRQAGALRRPDEILDVDRADEQRDEPGTNRDERQVADDKEEVHPRPHEHEVEQAREQNEHPPTSAIRVRLRASTIRLSKNSRTKKAQGLKASRPARTTVSTGRGRAEGSSGPRSGRSIGGEPGAVVTSSVARGSSIAAPATSSAWQASRLSRRKRPVVASSSQPWNERPQ
jgi:Periplasmic binding protein